MYYEDENNLYHYSYRKGDKVENVRDVDYTEVPNTAAKADPWEEKKPKKNRLGLKIAALALACALIGGAAGAGITHAITSAHGSTQIDVSDRQVAEVRQVKVDGKQQLTMPEVYAANVNSVVSINVSTTMNVFGRTTESAASGSGFFITKDGYILTNYHVIEGAKKITVRLRNGKSRSASVVGYDEGNDIAVLKIGGSGYTSVTIGKSKKVQVGDLAVAIGNRMGQVHGSVTAGIISAVEQELTIDDVTINAIQTDAAINPGNSGGALFDSYGNVIGIVYAKSSSVSIEGIGYAIPVNNIKDLVAQMINDPDSVKDQTKGSQIMLGITIRDITEEMSKQYSMPVGVYITEVSSMSAAERAGLQKGDIITEFAGETVTSADDLNAIKAKQTSGDTVSVKIDRNGKTLTLDLVVPQPTDVDTSSSK